MKLLTVEDVLQQEIRKVSEELLDLTHKKKILEKALKALKNGSEGQETSPQEIVQPRASEDLPKDPPAAIEVRDLWRYVYGVMHDHPRKKCFTCREIAGILLKRGIIHENETQFRNPTQRVSGAMNTLKRRGLVEMTTKTHRKHLTKWRLK